MKVVFFGTPEFAASILKVLVEKGVEIVGIVTRPDRPKGRSQKLEAPAVKAHALQLLPNVPIFQPEKCSTPETIEELKKLECDLFVVVSFGEIISQALLDVPPLGCINVHPSLLPKFRGAAPIQRTIMNGEKETGVCIIKMVRKMDAGDILYCEKIPLEDTITFGELEPKLALLGAKCLLKVLEGNTAPKVQDESLVTFAAKITPEECLIDWTRPAKEVYNKIRALSPHPGAFCFMSIRGQEKRMKILRAEFLEELPQFSSNNSFELPCGQGALRLQVIQPEGKPVMLVQEFLRGTPKSEILLLAKK